VFPFNERANQDGDVGRSNAAVLSIVGKRRTYELLTARPENGTQRRAVRVSQGVVLDTPTARPKALKGRQ